MSEPIYFDDRPIPDLLAFYATKVSRTLLEAALVYANRGWHVFPLYWIEDGRCACSDPACGSPGKHPLRDLVPHGHKQATIDDTMIGDWWSLCPRANIGIRTGAISKLIVMDIDSAKGGDQSFVELQNRIGRMTTSQRVATGSGGLHLYFGHPGDGRVFKGSVSKLGVGLDVRADNGYVVAPPSRNLKGKYVWLS
jgi:putative DNA primase/helicase